MNFDFRFYFALFARRLPIMLTIFLVCSGFGISVAINAAPTYSSSARLLIEEAQIEVGATNGVNADQELRLTRERLLTRANLVDIANEFGVFENMRDMSPDEVFEEMLENTDIILRGGRNQVALMTISFEARTGRIAANVVNEYLTIVQDDSTASNSQQIEDTLAFYQREADRLSGDLELQSARIVAFKAENAGALPDDADFRQNRQAQMIERLERIARERAATENRRADFVRLFEATGQIDQNEQPRLSPQQAQLAQLELELQNARSVYSDTNPRVVLLNNQVERLRQAVAAQAPTDTDDTFRSPQVAMLEIQLAEFQDNIDLLDAETIELQAGIDQLDRSLRATAANAIALAGLQRDFENLQQRYNAANAQLDQARLAQEVVVANQGQKLAIIESPNVPQDPSGPNRLRIAAVGIGLGLALAAGLFALLEIMNRSIRRPQEIESRFNITPIASIPYMESKGQRRTRLGVLAIALLFVLIGVPLALWYIDTNYQPLDIIVAKLINRLGL